MAEEMGEASAPTTGEEQVASTQAQSTAGTKLFLGGLSWETNEDKLKQYFSKYGEVEDVVVMKDKVTKQSRHFGFITFKAEEAATAACAETHTIDGRTIDAKPSVPHAEGQKPRSKKIFVGGLAPETTEDMFKAHFESFGKVTEAQIMVDHQSGRSRGFGFVTFEEEASVGKVFEAGPMHTLGGKQVEVKSATPKGSGPQAGRGGRGAAGGRGSPAPAGRGGPYNPQYGGYPGQQGYGMPGYGYGGYGQGYGGYYGGYGGYGSPYAYGTPGMMGYGAYGFGYGQGQGQAYGGQQQQQQQQQGADSRYHPYGSGGRGGGRGFQ